MFCHKNNEMRDGKNQVDGKGYTHHPPGRPGPVFHRRSFHKKGTDPFLNFRSLGVELDLDDSQVQIHGMTVRKKSCCRGWLNDFCKLIVAKRLVVAKQLVVGPNSPNFEKRLSACRLRALHLDMSGCFGFPTGGLYSGWSSQN